MALASSWPVTAAHSGPVSRLRIDVSRRNAADLGGLALEDLVGEVVEDEPVVARELGDERGRVARPCIDSAASWRAAIQPSVRASSTSTSAGGQGQVHGAVQVLGSLVRGEAEVGCSDLEQVAVCSQRGERERRIGAGGDHQAELRREVLEQEGHGVVDLGAVITW
jgi:hypothetical protein